MGFINLEWFSGPGHHRLPIRQETTDQVGASRQLALRCADVHSVSCDAEWTGSSASELVATAAEHGVRVHGFNPGWYSRERIAAISRAVRGTQGDVPPDLGTPTDTTTRQQPGDLELDEAAAVLCVSRDTLQAWERRFGYPRSVSGPAGERRYFHGEVIALRDSLEAGLSIVAAIDKARGVGADS
jgi:hypothetical protein